jgi:hypothetical protein
MVPSRRTLFVLFVVVFVCYLHGIGFSQESSYWQQTVSYVIRAELDTTNRTLTLDETITYRNNSPDTLRDFYLNLYERAYRGDDSFLMQDARKQGLLESLPKRNRGDLRVTSLELLSIGERTELPVTAFRIDDTLLSLRLPEPLPPGAELRLRLLATETIHRPLGRGGKEARSYFLVRWYPEVAVYDQEGWHAAPQRLLAGTYSEFADFEVTLTVPGNFIVAATGVPVVGEPGWKWVAADTSLDEDAFHAWHDSTRKALEAEGKRSGPRAITFRARNVTGFAIAAAADFVYEGGQRDGRPVHLLYRPGSRKKWGKKAVEHTLRALDWFTAKYGAYPYPQLTVVQRENDSFASPMLLASSSASEISLLFFLGQIYSHHILANEELTSAWLSNGLAAFMTKWYLEERYGPLCYDKQEVHKRGPFFLKYYPLPSVKDFLTNVLLFYMDSGADEPMGKTSTEFQDLAGFGMNAFLKGTVFFEMLRYVVGNSVFNDFCRSYYGRWAFKHVNEERLRQVAEEVSGQDLGWFFEQWLRRTPRIEYSLGEVHRKKTADGKWRTEVVVERLGDGIMPVEVALDLRKGRRVVKRVPGRALRDTVVFLTSAKPGGVLLDPQDQILDKDRLNNGGARYELRFDLPLTDAIYQPRDAYLLLWRPSIGFNDIDGLRLGLQLRGAYRAIYRTFKVAAYYGFESQTLDGVVQFGHPIPGLGNLSRYEVRAQKIEGRLEVRASFYLPLVRGLNQLPANQFRLILNHSRLLDEAYPFRELKVQGERRFLRDWDRGIVNRIALSYRLTQRGLGWSADLRATAETAPGFLGSQFDFQKVSAELIAAKRLLGFTLVGRVFAGAAFGRNAPPLQDQFWIDGVDPRTRYYLGTMRTRGDISPNWHFRVLGGGNLRGYYNQPRSGKRLVAGTVEVRRRMPLLGLPLSAFYDVGRLQHVDGRQETLADAGVGLRFEARFGPVSLADVELRIDFPFWVSDPLPGESKRKFRWVIGVGLPWP